MGDAADGFRAMKEARKEHKDQYRRGKMKDDIQLVVNEALHVEYRNAGEHLIVYGPRTTIDYWPSTERWIVRKPGRRKGYTAEALVAYMKRRRQGNAHI